MSEYPWNEKNTTFTWLSSLYNPFKEHIWIAASGILSYSFFNTKYFQYFLKRRVLIKKNNE